MNINIYYGGRGLLDDPTLYVINKIEEVLLELRVNVNRYNIYESKNSISTLPQTLKDADGIILATTVEWLGIGGYMQQFLDACWLYADKEKLATTYMQPVVMSTTYGEREGVLTLENAWEILGGLLCSGLSGYVDDLVSFEMNHDYNLLIEKKAENLYRTISQKMKSLPTSNQAITKTVQRTQKMELTPQESEQLSQYVSDDTYVKTQREDIEELASMFKEMLGEMKANENRDYAQILKNKFQPQEEFAANYLFLIEGEDKPLQVVVNNHIIEFSREETANIDAYAKLTKELFDDIIEGKMTFQRAFMTGEMTVKGNLKTLRMLDHIFPFA
ncbi:SCP2 sterol-binding domain-containing protein [Eubacterium oxidoreducens]|uniref:SCP-2 sterol transfer family protein n=1 Tax=Eubacterium oxidoreducens TaxID=1732 RepID=A0A1G6A063_EUBOX|nr:SCP2 sterol-binding domain-containing protein [Eubacterium oxidoreducens]SDB01775.1 SCP-2 sterol transfer family protein [Eubacterium oxidoreducens]